MKVFYLVVTLEPWDGNELLNYNIAGRYNSMEELKADRDQAAQRWIDNHDVPKPEPGKLRPIYTYDCIETI